MQRARPGSSARCIPSLTNALKIPGLCSLCANALVHVLRIITFSNGRRVNTAFGVRTQTFLANWQSGFATAFFISIYEPNEPAHSESTPPQTPWCDGSANFGVLCMCAHWHSGCVTPLNGNESKLTLCWCANGQYVSQQIEKNEHN